MSQRYSTMLNLGNGVKYYIVDPAIKKYWPSNSTISAIIPEYMKYPYKSFVGSISAMLFGKPWKLWGYTELPEEPEE